LDLGLCKCGFLNESLIFASLVTKLSCFEFALLRFPINRLCGHILSLSVLVLALDY
jgi:hypothetical protein